MLGWQVPESIEEVGMSGKAQEYGKSFMDQVYAKLPEDQRAAVKAVFDNPAAAEALVVIGAGALAQTDINKQYDAIKVQTDQLTADYTKLNEWYTTKQADLTELDEFRTGKKAPTNAPPAPTPAPSFDASRFVDRDEFAKVMRGEQMAAAGFLALQQTIGLQHLQKFGEVIDTRDLLTDAKLGQAKADGSTYGLLDAYQTKYHTQLAEYATKQETARIEKLVADRLAEERRTNPNTGVPLKVPTGSPLDALDAVPDPKAPAVNLADMAADHYTRLQADRLGAP